MNSPSTNLAWHFPSGLNASGSAHQLHDQHQKPAEATKLNNTMPSPGSFGLSAQSMPYSHGMQTTSANTHQRPTLTSYPTNGSTVSNADNTDPFLGMGSPYQANGTSATVAGTPGSAFSLHPTTSNTLNNAHGGFATHGSTGHEFNTWDYNPFWDLNDASAQDMMIESQDVDMSMLGLDMMPWFDSHPTHNLAGLFDPGGGHGSGDAAGGAAHGTPH